MPYNLSSVNNRALRRLSPKVAKGFTLIEIIIAIVTLSIALSIITSLILPIEEQSADQLHQIKAAELAQSFLNEISSKAFDENSDHGGGVVRCGEQGISCSSTLGPESGETRKTFNDVDDYHGYSEHKTSTEGDIAQGYDSFTIDISVIYDGDSLGLTRDTLAKRITVNVTTPLGTSIVFTSYKVNY